jgi:hypothetical protein
MTSVASSSTEPQTQEFSAPKREQREEEESHVVGCWSGFRYDEWNSPCGLPTDSASGEFRRGGEAVRHGGGNPIDGLPADFTDEAYGRDFRYFLGL